MSPERFFLCRDFGAPEGVQSCSKAIRPDHNDEQKGKPHSRYPIALFETSLARCVSARPALFPPSPNDARSASRAHPLFSLQAESTPQ